MSSQPPSAPSAVASQSSAPGSAASVHQLGIRIKAAAAASGSSTTPHARPPTSLASRVAAAVRFLTGWRWDIPEDEVCGICRVEFERCCPSCKTPGDDCPPVWGACNHAFHMHCIVKWLDAQKDKEAECPLCRRPWEFRADESPSKKAVGAGGEGGAGAAFASDGKEGQPEGAPTLPGPMILEGASTEAAASAGGAVGGGGRESAAATPTSPP